MLKLIGKRINNSVIHSLFRREAAAANGGERCNHEKSENDVLLYSYISYVDKFVWRGERLWRRAGHYFYGFGAPSCFNLLTYYNDLTSTCLYTKLVLGLSVSFAPVLLLLCRCLVPSKEDRCWNRGRPIPEIYGYRFQKW